jgi:hypothetical protein
MTTWPAIPGVGTVQSLASIVRVAEELNEGREFDPFELNVIYKRLPVATCAMSS